MARIAGAWAALSGVVLIVTGIALGGHAGALFVAFLALAAASVALAALIAVPKLRMLAALEGQARAFARSDFAVRTPPGADSLSPLAVALNEAADAIGALVQRLGAERAQLETLLNASNDATIAVDAAGIVTYMNDSARALFAGPGGPGRPFIEVVRDHDLNDVLIAAAARGERSVRVVPYGAQQRWLQATAVPIRGPSPWAALAVFHDLTEVRRLDSVRRDFLSNVSHELRTPLAGIRAAAETLQEGAIDDPAAGREFLAHIQRETDRMTQLVEELLELSRIESGAAPMRFRQVDAAQLVRDAAARFAQQAQRARLDLRVDAPGEPLPVYGDPERLDRALGNLIANAIKFTPAGGCVTVGARADDGDVLLRVEDTGIGMEPAQQARVFERFYKADPGRGGGTGLGLAVVKHIVLAHEGTVAVVSRPGRGSTFTIRLPRR